MVPAPIPIPGVNFKVPFRGKQIWKQQVFYYLSNLFFEMFEDLGGPKWSPPTLYTGIFGGKDYWYLRQ